MQVDLFNNLVCEVEAVYRPYIKPSHNCHQILNILTLIDHIILTHDSFYSFQECGEC